MPLETRKPTNMPVCRLMTVMQKDFGDSSQLQLDVISTRFSAILSGIPTTVIMRRIASSLRQRKWIP